MIEVISKVLKKINISLYRMLNYKLYKNKVILYGIPKLIDRDKIILNKNVRINNNIFMQGSGGIEIKENVTLSHGVTIISAGYEIDDWEKNKIEKKHEYKKVIIGENVWVCANVTILPGIPPYFFKCVAVM